MGSGAPVLGAARGPVSVLADARRPRAQPNPLPSPGGRGRLRLDEASEADAEQAEHEDGAEDDGHSRERGEPNVPGANLHHRRKHTAQAPSRIICPGYYWLE